MSLYDIAKTQRLMADGKTDKEIAENMYQISKQIVRELAQDFQLADNDYRITTSQILDFYMPEMPNPLQSWQTIKTPSQPFLPLPSSVQSPHKSKHKIGKVGILKGHKKVHPESSQSIKGVNFVRDKKSSRMKVSLVNESVIKKAIEETDWNLNLSMGSRHKEKGAKKPKLDNIRILEYVAKSFALLGRKVKSSMKKNKKTDLFADQVIMPVSMKPNLVIENFEIGTKRNKNVRRIMHKHKSYV